MPRLTDEELHQFYEVVRDADGDLIVSQRDPLMSVLEELREHRARADTPTTPFVFKHEGDI